MERFRHPASNDQFDDASDLDALLEAVPMLRCLPGGGKSPVHFDEVMDALRPRSFLIDGEAVACDGDGLPVFNRLRYRRPFGRSGRI